MREIAVDVAVIGAGIIGAAAAAELASRGRSVAIVDSAQPTAGTSGSCDGYLSVSTKVPGLAMEMAVESQRLWAALGPGLGDVGYSAEGGLMIVDDALFHGDALNAKPTSEKGQGSRDALDLAAEWKGYCKCLLPVANGMLLLMKERA